MFRAIIFAIVILGGTPTVGNSIKAYFLLKYCEFLEDFLKVF